MNIAVIGAGNIGGTLGRRWAEVGHEVAYGLRDRTSDKARALLEAFPAADIRPVAEALVFGRAVLIATPHAAAAGLARQHAAALAGKIVIDATNNFGDPVISSVPAILEAAPEARVFRAFNSLGWEVFADPQVGGVAADHFYCGPDDEARPAVEGLIADLGLRPIWIGGHEMLPVVDGLGALWVTLALRRGWGRGTALKLLQR